MLHLQKIKRMKKLILSLVLLTCPIAFSFGQLSVSGVTGNNDYSAVRASYNLSMPLTPLSITPKFAMYEQDGMDTMYQYGIGANMHVPFYDLLEVGAEAAYTPKANDYSNYLWDVHAALNIQNLLFRLLPLDELKAGLGYKTIYHTFHATDTDVTEQDIYMFLYQKNGGLDTRITFTKALDFSGDKTGTPLWLDVPGFTAVYQGYLDYSLSVDAGYTYKFIRPYAGYTFIKTDNAPSSDDARLGLILSVAMINFNASVEWFNFTQNTADRQTFFSFTAGVSI